MFYLLDFSNLGGMTVFKNKINVERYGYIFIAPYFIVFIMFHLYPILYSFFISLNKWDGVNKMQFIGFSNYARILKDDVFYKAIFNTWAIWIFAVTGQMVLAMLLAVILNDRHLKGRDFFRAVFYLPNIVTAASIGVLFSAIFAWQTGSFNRFLIQLGIIQEPINWYMYPAFARGMNSLVLFWMWFGYSSVFFLAGLKSISEELYEAAAVDGATKWNMFWKITLPLMKPIIIYSIITSLIGGMQIFDVPFTMTDGMGSPEKTTLTMVMYLFLSAFRYNNYGYGAAVAYALFLLTVTFSLISLKLMLGKKESL